MSSAPGKTHISRDSLDEMARKIDPDKVALGKKIFDDLTACLTGSKRRPDQHTRVVCLDKGDYDSYSQFRRQTTIAMILERLNDGSLPEGDTLHVSGLMEPYHQSGAMVVRPDEVIVYGEAIDDLVNRAP
jgi:hypothetical protein